jgi:hypothetical protein
MLKKQALKLFSILLIIILTFNLILFVLGRINPLIFWILIIVIAIFAYRILPKLRST